MDNIKQLGEEKISSLIIKFSIPSIIGMLVNALYNIIDRIFIGQGVNSLGLAGITIGFPISIIMFAFSVLIAIGSTSLMSIKLGEKKRDEAEHIMGNAVLILLLISLILTVIGILFLDPILKLFGSSNEVLPYARDYMRVIILGSIFNTIGYGVNNFIRADGSPRIAMIRLLISAVLNAIFAPIFIFGFKWGMAGAGLATVVSQAISAIWGAQYFLNGKSSLKIHSKYLFPKPEIVSQIISLGAPAFSMQLVNSLINIVLNKSLMKYGGDVAISGMGIINSIQTLVVLPVVGISQGIQPIIGYNFGAEKYNRVKQTLKLGITVATSFVIIGFIIIRLFPEPIIALFSGKDTALIKFGTHALLIYFMCLPFIGFQIISSNYFQAVGKVKPAMFLSLSRQLIILIPALLILPSYFKLNGVLYSPPLSDFLSSVITGLWLFKELNHLNIKHKESIDIA